MRTAVAINKQINTYLNLLNARQQKAVLTVVKTFVEDQNESWSEKDYTKEMNNRFTSYENGKLKSYTLEETEARAKQAYKIKKKR